MRLVDEFSRVVTELDEDIASHLGDHDAMLYNGTNSMMRHCPDRDEFRCS